LKLTTDRHETSRGLFATAELLVSLRDATVYKRACLYRRAVSVCLSVCRVSVFCQNEYYILSSNFYRIATAF